jgi:salicylate hydroxylase
MRIAVAGAGIAGLTAAIALAERGFDVELYERAADLEEIGAGIQLSPNAMAVLERLGLASEIAPSLIKPEAIEIYDAAHGVRLTRIPLGETARRRYGSPYCLVHRADLQAVLLAVARTRERIALNLGAEVESVRATERGIVFNVGGRKVSTDVLVAADGVHSALRTAYFGRPEAQRVGSTAWRAALPMTEVPDFVPRDCTGLWLAPGAHLVHYPVQAGRRLNVVLIATGDTAEPPTAPFGPLASRLVEMISSWTRWPLWTVDPAGPWARGPAVLIGDAAHAMLPTAAQGGAQAIEDAWTLAELLAERPADPAAALKAFERTRRPRVERVVRAAQNNLFICGLRGFQAQARNGILKMLPANLHLARLDWLYAWRPSKKA